MRKPLLIFAAAAGAALLALSGSDSEIEAFPTYGVPQQGWGSQQQGWGSQQQGWGSQQQAWGNPQMNAQNAMALQSMMMMNGAANAGAAPVQRDNFWWSRVGAGNYDPVSGAGYVSVPGHGPIGFGM